MTNYYINADTGNDTTGDGSSGLPWLTMGKAHTEASDGDTIVCQDSTAAYTLATITFAKGLIIQGEQSDASGAVFDGGSTGNARSWRMEGYTCSISKLTFQNARYDNPASNGSILSSFGASSVLAVRNCVFINLLVYTPGNANYGGGVIGGNAGNNTTGLDLTVENCLFDDIVAIATSSHSHIISGRVWATGALTMSGNTLFFSTAANSVNRIAGIGNNTFTPSFRNNIFSNETGNAISMGTSVADADYCCAYNITSGPSGDSNITSDPLFVDAANANYNLRPSSPCIDTGVLT